MEMDIDAWDVHEAVIAVNLLSTNLVEET
jgi:hypothetical protein